MERIKSYWEWEHPEEGIVGPIGDSSNCMQGYNERFRFLGLGKSYVLPKVTVEIVESVHQK